MCGVCQKITCMCSPGSLTWGHGVLILAVRSTLGAHSTSAPIGAGCSPLLPSVAAVVISLPPRAQPLVLSD